MAHMAGGPLPFWVAPLRRAETGFAGPRRYPRGLTDPIRPFPFEVESPPSRESHLLLASSGPASLRRVLVFSFVSASRLLSSAARSLCAAARPALSTSAAASATLGLLRLELRHVRFLCFANQLLDRGQRQRRLRPGFGFCRRNSPTSPLLPSSCFCFIASASDCRSPRSPLATNGRARSAQRPPCPLMPSRAP